MSNMLPNMSQGLTAPAFACKKCDQNALEYACATVTCTGTVQPRSLQRAVRCVSIGVAATPSTAQPEEPSMAVAQEDEVVLSSVIDVSDVPLHAEMDIDGPEYIRIMRRIGIREGESVTPVSAFNSSI